MSCETVIFDAANDPERCKCKSAVLRAYTLLLSSGTPEAHALDAARTVYRYHHPEDGLQDASLTVERWVYQQKFH